MSPIASGGQPGDLLPQMILVHTEVWEPLVLHGGDSTCRYLFFFSVTADLLLNVFGQIYLLPCSPSHIFVQTFPNHTFDKYFNVTLQEEVPHGYTIQWTYRASVKIRKRYSLLWKHSPTPQWDTFQVDMAGVQPGTLANKQLTHLCLWYKPAQNNNHLSSLSQMCATQKWVRN